MDLYDRLGVRKVINAQGSVSKIGGSLMAPDVVNAMVEAGQSYVEISEFLEKAGKHLATLIGVEAAFITSGAAAGLVVSTAACVAGKDSAKIFRLPDTGGMKNEIIIHRQQRNHYDSCIRQVGVKLVEIGLARETHPWELEEAISENTAAVVYFVAYARTNSLPLQQVVAIAHKAHVPVIVDAADELPPASNLRRFADAGADLVIFSGGKAIGGPQSSGLILGTRSLIDACALNAFPNYAIGRPMKIGKEEIAGLVVAVERYLCRDLATELAIRDRQVSKVLLALRDVPGISVERIIGPREEPELHPFDVPRALITISSSSGIKRDDVIRSLKNGNPPVHVLSVGDRIVVTTQGLRDGDEDIVAHRLCEIMGRATSISR
ncbi:MAG: aminotransferase class V-fold PLP-dependent enzyme [bacterium]